MTIAYSLVSLIFDKDAFSGQWFHLACPYTHSSDKYISYIHIKNPYKTFKVIQLQIQFRKKQQTRLTVIIRLNPTKRG